MTVTCKAEGMYPEPEVSLVVQRSRFKRSVVRDDGPGEVAAMGLENACLRRWVLKALQPRTHVGLSD